MKKGEDVIGFKEAAKSPAGAAVLVTIPAIAAGAAGLAADLVGGMAVAAGIVGGVVIAAFITALLMGKAGSRKALVVTSQRSISVVGSERMELKN